MADEADRANLEIEREEERRNQEIKRKQLKEAPNDVVECIDCGDEIPPARKAAKPSAKRCIDCEDLHERFNL